MSAITDAKDSDLSRFLFAKAGSLHHGWADPEGPGQPTLIYKKVLETTFHGDEQAARRVRLFHVSGMGHCGDGPGPNT